MEGKPGEPTRFRRGPKYPNRPEDYSEPDPSLCLAAARRAVARARAKHEEELGFLAEVIPGPQETPEERVARYRAVARAEYCQHHRDERAREWKDVRALLRSRPAEDRAKIVAEWNASEIHGYAPRHFRYLIHQISPPPEEVERREQLRQRDIAWVSSLPRYIEHVGCGPLKEWAVPGIWTCLGCGWEIHRGNPKVVEAAREGVLVYRFNGEGAVWQPSLLEGVA